MNIVARVLMWAIDTCETRNEMRECADENAEALALLEREAPELRAEVKAHAAKRWQEVR